MKQNNMYGLFSIQFVTAHLYSFIYIFSSTKHAVLWKCVLFLGRSKFSSKRAFNILVCNFMSFITLQNHSEGLSLCWLDFVCFSLALSVSGLRSEFSMDTHKPRPERHNFLCLPKQHLYIESPLVFYRKKGPHLSFPSERGRTSVSIRVCIRIIIITWRVWDCLCV